MTSTPRPPSRSSLIKKASRYRTLSSLLSILDRYLSWPLPSKPELEIAIPSQSSKCPGSIDLHIFTAPSKGLSSRVQSTKPRPVLINFHGGGFSIGHALDDSRWASAVLKTYPDAVVISVNYRLAPEHPFPVALDDGTDTILWLWEHADRYNLDKTRFCLSGFSAGGNLALTVPFRLYDEQRKRSKISLAGQIAFYPSVDWTHTRAERNASNPIAVEKSMISDSVYWFFDHSYLFPGSLPKVPGGNRVNMAHPYLSPGRAAEEALLAAYAPAVAIYTCAWDQLLVEGEAFRDRLGRLVREGKMGSVGGFVVEGVIHGFDKKPSFWRKAPERERMYSDALRELGIMWKIG
ncbi:unnamed protein product [Penicillium salamii]|uniref:Alpha/beta hydrolase fold-3 domain-containing protein n=1 Tax=Penicillium salamii TaxID=1612424 RepID=A0A9W4JMG0_9EURO|nr:unnamed protein product [Penicillium salamii]CAG8299634.1 unnamed protein product [Penicillium salamii]CAG8353401.1 unnamed protein product [Penicillium salamii]CAG8359559.1 unnamed protein product [Penicillium salamii]CAG8367955.1 unnamed protein product [Penicillium salamii]